MNKRLFIAIDPPSEIREQLAGICCGLPETRWTPLEQMHLTLCFIGDVSGAAFYDIKEALGDIKGAPFSLRLQGVGFFPPRQKPRVVWVGVEKSEPLHLLQRKIITRLFVLNLELESRKFAPHVTLARLHETPISRIGRYLQEHNLFASAEFFVNEFTLYSSVLGRKGAHHMVEQVYQL